MPRIWNFTVMYDHRMKVQKHLSKKEYPEGTGIVIGNLKKQKETFSFNLC